jgi:hypothetical protein
MPPVLFHDSDGKATIHHAEVIDISETEHQSPVFDPVEQEMTPQDASERAMAGNPYSKAELARIRVEAANAQPNVDKKFPSCKILIAGFENGERLDQLPVEYNFRMLDMVDVVEGDLNSIAEPQQQQIGAASENP